MEEVVHWLCTGATLIDGLVQDCGDYSALAMELLNP